MKTAKHSFLHAYRFTLILLGGIILGTICGFIFGEKARVLKPFGDIFLNLMFTVVVPVVFFSIASAVAGMKDKTRLRKIFFWMLVIFIITGIIASVIMLTGVTLFPPAEGITITVPDIVESREISPADQIVKAFTVSDFKDLFSKKNMLALILFSIIIGVGASSVGEKARPFIRFLEAGNEVMMNVVHIIMYYAPIGLGAYFAYLVGVFGPELMKSYVRAVTLYYPLAFAYFFCAFTLYAYIAGKGQGVRMFWTNIVPPAITALGTGSSVATIPSNLEAAEKSGVPRDVREIVIPIGATIHMDGSCLAAILKIALLFGLFNRPFTGFETILIAIGIAVLSGSVMSGIPGGGFIGELLIITLYNFPVEALPIISMVDALVDPPATMVNAAGDNVVSMMVGKLVGKSAVHGSRGT